MIIRCGFSKRKIKYIASITFLFILIVVSVIKFNKKIISNIKNYLAGDIVDFTFANNVTGYDYPIVPNIVHYVNFDTKDLNFIQVISIKAVVRNSAPEKIFIHCNCYSLFGKYWDMVKNISILEIKYKNKPTHVFGKLLSSVFHASDIARLQILMTYGGIFLDSDTYVIKSLNYYRRFEMALGWPPDQNLGTQLLVAHKNARFLRLWFNSYRYYRRERWYYNAGELPTTFILERMPYLVHRVLYDFGIHNLVQMLYGVRSREWKDFHAIHLLVRHKNYLLPGDTVTEFNEENIKHYNKTFGDMARLVLYGSEKLF
ncbi:uncharacterized protein [Parasteatoda tepidariorum]|uniref:uncharacterized protein n=1 Tax=Parasteatoda tepidariorum TaxID=114398 RepID=UPI00077F8FBF|nr:uncharacterized protein LOC107447270 [Parasteatoda tepidariorum]